MGNRVAWMILGALLALGATALFWVQNSSRTTQLSFDIGVAAWQLQEPIPIPVLMATCLAIGFGIGFVPMGLRQTRLSGRIAELEQRLAVSEVEKGGAARKEPGTW